MGNENLGSFLVISFLSIILTVITCRRWLHICATSALRAEVAELADAHDSKSCSQKECGFDSHPRHHINLYKFHVLLINAKAFSF